jgi:hypothetical protein
MPSIFRTREAALLVNRFDLLVGHLAGKTINRDMEHQ